MNIETFRDYCLAKKGVTEELPFGPDTLVYKVMGKIFALTGLDSEIFSINLKNSPEKNLAIRAESDAIKAGFHMNKKHWNTVTVDHRLKEAEVRQLIDESYEIVVNGLQKALKEQLNSV